MIATRLQDDVVKGRLLQWGDAFASLAGIGAPGLLKDDLLGVISSRACPGRLILKAHDRALALREEGAAVISGFHSPVEDEFWQVLIAGRNPLVQVYARGIGSLRLSPDQKRLLEDGRLLILSPFPDSVKRATKATALVRNRLVAALAERVLVVYAAPGGATEGLCREIEGWGKSVERWE